MNNPIIMNEIKKKKKLKAFYKFHKTKQMNKVIFKVKVPHRINHFIQLN